MYGRSTLGGYPPQLLLLVWGGVPRCKPGKATTTYKWRQMVGGTPPCARERHQQHFGRVASSACVRLGGGTPLRPTTEGGDQGSCRKRPPATTTWGGTPPRPTHAGNATRVKTCSRTLYRKIERDVYPYQICIYLSDVVLFPSLFFNLSLFFLSHSLSLSPSLSLSICLSLSLSHSVSLRTEGEPPDCPIR